MQQKHSNTFRLMLGAFVVSAVTLLSFVKPAFAKECYSVYGGGEVCETGDLIINKKVYNPKTGSYVDNIASSDYVFKPGEEIKFSLTIKNISDIKVDNARINDDFDAIDEYLNYLSSIDNQGDYRLGETDWKVKFDKIGSLDPGQEKTLYFTAQVKASEQIPVGITCPINVAHAYSHDDITSDTDHSEFCIGTDSGKIVTGKTPETGVNLSLVLSLEALALAAIGGLALRQARKLSK
jgi:hypothetical protein